MSTAHDLLRILKTWHKMPTGQLLERLGVSRATLMRAVQSLGDQIVVRGRARKTAYAARRALRGSWHNLPLYRIDADGQAHEVSQLQLLYPAGCALDGVEQLGWPLDASMRDGWFEGLPYFLDDMRPQGFLGRHFAARHADVLQVGTDPRMWSEDDTLHALCLLGHDMPGNLIVGEAAMRQWLNISRQDPVALRAHERVDAYPRLALEALQHGVAGSSAGGEFPKFTAIRTIDGQAAHVIVKFSGSDGTPGAVRWSDLLVCEHLALAAVAAHLALPAAASQLYQAAGRTFLEVARFDRHGAHGRSAVCSWQALNAALCGLAGKPWGEAGAALRQLGLISADVAAGLQRLGWFGRLIANTDMHDGNLSFRPGLKQALALAPVYDMLPMAYAPARGMELPATVFVVSLPLPAERDAWRAAAQAAEPFWNAASMDARISPGFRNICASNAAAVAQALRKVPEFI